MNLMISTDQSMIKMKSLYSWNILRWFAAKVNELFNTFFFYRMGQLSLLFNICYVKKFIFSFIEESYLILQSAIHFHIEDNLNENSWFAEQKKNRMKWADCRIEVYVTPSRSSCNHYEEKVFCKSYLKANMFLKSCGLR